MTLNDLRPAKKCLVNVSQFLAAAHILKANCDETAGDRPGQTAHDEIFSVKRRLQRFKLRLFILKLKRDTLSFTPKMVILPLLAHFA